MLRLSMVYGPRKPTDLAIHKFLKLMLDVLPIPLLQLFALVP
jgi:nucleoside-diphosphate-sugar epimerase